MTTKLIPSPFPTPLSPIERHYFSLVTIGCLFVPIFYVGTLTGAERIRKMARRASLRPAEEVLQEDQRPPVLFLRAFEDDQVSLKSAAMPAYSRVADPGIEYANLEEVLEAALNIGPVVAIGHPEDVVPPIGAVRRYVEGDAWQNVVVSLMDQAALIVVGVSDSEGVVWEIEQLCNRGYLGKSVFIIPPRHRWNRRLVYQLLLKLLRVSDVVESDGIAAELGAKLVEGRSSGSVPSAHCEGVRELPNVVADRIRCHFATRNFGITGR